eukprot:CAMPEP_0206521168 /NCGR_PEP_ID=MMETSP0324_2-20121206/66175_1 /ASSEMBLY_ACC=CAM_ASM_000836 /TAXON_ID=2866 /ORGANISM="Crypthecodinium cohnii, Strain Seligo" /LENGTH=217 /DNA_ID=CAMNT_0054014987 /DNA_START=180 /DNA_END=834 /DNA_ORIENTATION=+
MAPYTTSRTWEQESWTDEGKNGRRRRRRRVARGAHSFGGSMGEGYHTSDDEGRGRKTEPRHPGVVSWLDLGVSDILTMPSASEPPSPDELAAGSLPKQTLSLSSAMSSTSSSSPSEDPTNATSVAPGEGPGAVGATTSTAETDATTTAAAVGFAEMKTEMDSTCTPTIMTPTMQAEDVPQMMVPVPMMLPMPNNAGAAMNGQMYAFVVAAPYQAGPR